MEDATLVEKTKSRWLGVKKLKNLATESFVINFDALTQKEGGNYIKSQLTPQLRDDVLQELLRTRQPGELNKTIEEFNKLKQALRVLMSTKTTKLDLNILMSFLPVHPYSKDESSKVLMMIATAAPNVRYLKIAKKILNDCFSSDSSRDACIRFLSSLKELRILEIVGWAYDKVDVALLCKELPNLRVLSAKDIALDTSKMSEEEIRNSFGHLTLLEDSFLSIGNMCHIWKVLPNLDIIWDVEENGLKLEDFVKDEYLHTKGRKYLDFETSLLNSNVCADADFSGIRHLKFTYNEEKWNKLNMTLKGKTPLESLDLFITNPPPMCHSTVFDSWYSTLHFDKIRVGS